MVAEYNKPLEHATGKVRTVIKLMGWSGLAVRDAATLKGEDISFDKSTGFNSIIREHTKTGKPLYLPLPPDLGAVSRGQQRQSRLRLLK